MKLTGKQLYEWWGGPAARPYMYNIMQEQWDALAERLNGMNGEPIDACPLCHRKYEGRGEWGDKIVGTFMKCEDIDLRARHHSTCPYRHGKGDCTCGPD